MTQGRAPAIRVAFIVPRCGLEVNGGAEAYCLKIAQRMSAYWQTEVLTTCALDYMTWEDYYAPGATQVAGVPVRRFRVEQPRNVTHFNQLSDELLAHKEEMPLAKQEIWMRAQGPWSPDLAAYVRENKDNYDVFFFLPYLYATTYFLLPIVSKKAYLVPLAHDEWTIYFSMWDALFALPCGFVFNTPEERDFLRLRFPTLCLDGPIVGIGVDPPKYIDGGRFRQKYGVNEPFALYIGRIDPSKGCDELFRYFVSLREKESSPRKLVLLGKTIMAIPEHPDLIALGFVDEQTKWDALSACDLLIVPSQYESLSLVLLEAWSAGKPVLVNRSCKVLVGQCQRAQGGLSYSGFEEFCAALKSMTDDVKRQLGLQGKEFVQQRYTWPVIEEQYLNVLNNSKC
jgi:glycosyltransferase involved in cell wall biosynthesis